MRILSRHIWKAGILLATISLGVGNTVYSQEVKSTGEAIDQGDLAQIVIEVKHLDHKVARATFAGQAVLLEKMGIEPQGGWDSDKAVDRDELAYLVVHAMRRNVEVQFLQEEKKLEQGMNGYIQFLESIHIPVPSHPLTEQKVRDYLENELRIPLSDPVATPRALVLPLDLEKERKLDLPPLVQVTADQPFVLTSVDPQAVQQAVGETGGPPGDTGDTGGGGGGSGDEGDGGGGGDEGDGGGDEGDGGDDGGDGDPQPPPDPGPPPIDPPLDPAPDPAPPPAPEASPSQ